MKLKIWKFLSKLNIAAITLCPFGIYFSDERHLKNEVIVNHEKIHWKQQVEMLVLPFYLWYITEWFIKLITPPRGAYLDISFEREAYGFQKKLDYLKVRKHYNWLKLIHVDESPYVEKK